MGSLLWRAAVYECDDCDYYYQSNANDIHIIIRKTMDLGAKISIAQLPGIYFQAS